MEQQIAEFRRQLEAEFRGIKPGRGTRYSRVLRERALALVQERLAHGATLSAAAEQLGLPIETVRRWRAEAPAVERALRPVEVVIEDASGPGRSLGAGLVLITANGHRVEGLALAQVAQLLEVLG